MWREPEKSPLKSLYEPRLRNTSKASISKPGLELRREPPVLRPTRNNPKLATLQSNNFQNTECTMSRESWDQADTPEKPTTVSVSPRVVRLRCEALAGDWQLERKGFTPGHGGRCPS